MEKHRELVVSVLLPHLDKTSREKPMQELYPLSWEKEYKKGEGKPLDKKEAKRRWALADAREAGNDEEDEDSRLRGNDKENKKG